MPTVALTDRFCASAKTLKSTPRTDYFDETVPGLALRVTEHGHRSWCFHFRAPGDGKRARATIGTYPATSLATARGKAIEARQHVEAGQDPRRVLAGQGAAGMTLAGLVDAYLADPEKAALRSRDEIARRLRKNVVPIIGGVKATELRRRHARTVTDPILRRGSKVEATRVFEDLRAVVRWSVENEYLEANPLDGMSKPAESTSSNRVLTDDEIRTLWNGLPKAMARSVDCQRIIKLCLVTAQRVGEVAGMTRAELDLKAREWRLPSDRTKMLTRMSCPYPIWRSPSSRKRLRTHERVLGYSLAAKTPCPPLPSRARSCGRMRLARSGRRGAFLYQLGVRTIYDGRLWTGWPSSACCRTSLRTSPTIAP